MSYHTILRYRWFRWALEVIWLTAIVSEVIIGVSFILQ